jgi:hypothetical protein
MSYAKMFIVGVCAGAFATSAWAQSSGGEVDHSKVDHAAMGHGVPATDGPWSYKNRQNPEPHKQGRWEMVPVPEYGHMFLSVEGLSSELRCAALQNPGVMVDRASRKACGLPELPQSMAKSPTREAVDHKALGY